MIAGFDTTVFPRLDYKQPDKFWKTIRFLQDFFAIHEDRLGKVHENALIMKKYYDDFDPFLQRYTAKVCPYCGTVCCANKFGFPEFADVVSFLSLGLPIPRYDLNVDEEAICQFIGGKGCILHRIQRPYRCTWYFCDPLMVQIDVGPAKHYRKFIQDVQDLGRARGDLMREFFSLWTELAWEME